MGATVHLNYCIYNFIEWSLLKVDGDKCYICGMEKDGGCCKDENKFVKNNIDQKVAEPSIQLIQMAAIISPVAFLYISEHFISIIQGNSISHAPPRNNGVGIYILNNVFRL